MAALLRWICMLETYYRLRKDMRSGVEITIVTILSLWWKWGVRNGRRLAGANRDCGVISEFRGDVRGLCSEGPRPAYHNKRSGVKLRNLVSGCWCRHNYLSAFRKSLSNPLSKTFEVHCATGCKIMSTRQFIFIKRTDKIPELQLPEQDNWSPPRTLFL